MLRPELRVPVHHHPRLPATQLLQLVAARASLPMPRPGGREGEAVLRSRSTRFHSKPVISLARHPVASAYRTISTCRTPCLTLASIIGIRPRSLPPSSSPQASRWKSSTRPALRSRPALISHQICSGPARPLPMNCLGSASVLRRVCAQTAADAVSVGNEDALGRL